MINAISLFTGIGGLDLAAEACGINIVAMCEKDDWCRELLKDKFDCEIHTDIEKFSAENFNGIDLVFGGFPCQPFSVSGNQKGEEDERYLWGEFNRIISECKPEFVLAENVKGLLNCGIERIVSDLEGQGYEVTITLCAASVFGAVHQRERVFIVGHKTKRQITNTTGNGLYGGEKCGRYSQIDDRTEERKDKTEYFERCGTLWPILQGVYQGSIWESLPLIRRMDDGVPSKLDKIRLKALGNAVVPLQAYPFFKFIKEVLENNG